MKKNLINLNLFSIFLYVITLINIENNSRIFDSRGGKIEEKSLNSESGKKKEKDVINDINE
jgi:hypothetical protein